MKQQHYIVNFIVAVIGWMLTPCVFLLWTIGTILHESTLVKYSRRFGKLLRSRTRTMTIGNMQTVLHKPAWSQGQWDELWKSHAEHVARTIFEMIRFESMPLDEVRKRITVDGEQHLQHALAGGNGVMMFFNHLGNLASAISGIALKGYDITLAGNSVWIPYMEHKVRNLHERVSAKRALIGDDLPGTAAQIFRRNGIFATFIDFSVTVKHTAWMPLGQAELAMNLGPAIIALRHQVPVICVSSFRSSEHSHHVVLHPPITEIRGDDIHEKATNLLRRALQFLETDLDAHPEQWWPWNYAPLRHRHTTLAFNSSVNAPDPEHP